jgi:hypothetical protein
MVFIKKKLVESIVKFLKNIGLYLHNLHFHWKIFAIFAIKR